MRLLLVSPIPEVSQQLGASQVTLNLKTALEARGIDCQLFPDAGRALSRAAYPAAVAAFLDREAPRFDVIEIPDTLVNITPTNARPRPLWVVRSPLLDLQRFYIRYPDTPMHLRAALRRPLSMLRAAWQRRRRNVPDRSTLLAFYRAYDLVVVANSLDRDRLLENGLPPARVAVIPFALDDARHASLGALPVTPQTDPPVLVFLGTFDYRKGCLDIRTAFRRLRQAIPDLRLRLIGTRGMIRDEAGVLAAFPKHLRSAVDVTPHFRREDLPGLLTGARAGVFPSYWEGFGLGVVEMLAAGLPVAAYRAPGPADILPAEWLAAPGDVNGLVAHLLPWLLDDEPTRTERAARARRIADPYRWDRMARETEELYRDCLARRREDASS
ncbi:MAG: glycosyltransferase family 4 protein [Opitutales bacterium]